jgi:hypothetical protein
MEGGLRLGDLSPLFFLAIDRLHYIVPKDYQARPPSSNWWKNSNNPYLSLHRWRGNFVAPIEDDINFPVTTLTNFWNHHRPCHQLFKEESCTYTLWWHWSWWTCTSRSGQKNLLPMKYLGLPLSVTHLKGINFQQLVDRVAGKVVPWIGKHAQWSAAWCLSKRFY